MRRRGIIALVIMAAASAAAVLLIVAGEWDLGRVVAELTPQLVLFLSLQVAVPILLAASFFVRRGRRVGFRVSALVIVVGLVAFHFLEPLRPFSMPPNHPDPGDWDNGRVVHIIPTASENAFLIKVSLAEPVDGARLILDSQGAGGASVGAEVAPVERPLAVPGEMTDTAGETWRFFAEGLLSDHRYTLRLTDEEGAELCDPWPLSTLPPRTATLESLRLVAINGAGGHDAARTWYGKGQMPHEHRVAMLNRALSFEPDLLFGAGDQIYYDLKYGISPKTFGRSRRARHHNGEFDFEQAVLGTQNEEVLKASVGPQIAHLFGTSLRSTPSFFLLDDHDYFVNDEARAETELNLQLLLVWLDPVVEAGVSLPPEPFLLELARTAQSMYLPEFLPDPTRPLHLPGTGASGRVPGTSEAFGSLRYGRLFEGVAYDVRRFLSLGGEEARFVPQAAEEWLVDRAVKTNARHFVHLSPFAYGFGAGKWQSWYPDVKGVVDGVPSLTTEEPKYFWQPGWFAQHNRLLGSLASTRAAPLILAGDMHAQAAGLIRRSGTLDLSTRPVPTVLLGSMGVDGGGYPSGGLRGIEAQPPTDLDVDVLFPALEEAGFVVAEFTADEVVIRMFSWRFGRDDPAQIPVLEPHTTLRFPRGE